MPVFESSRKVQVFGSSLALTLPAMFVKASEIKKGSTISVLYGLDGVLVVTNCEDPKTVKDCLAMILDKLEEKAGHGVEGRDV
ncbi:MAG: hypothetical protein ACTSPV_02695 [Candidatus Hodarchaeales archaeon]